MKRILTLDVGAANVALAEYELGAGGALKLVNYGISALAAPVDSGDAATILAPAIMEIVREKGIRPGPVAISVSGQMVFPRFAAIPDVGGEDKFEQNIRYEIEQNVPFPIDEMICDRQVLGTTESGDRNVMIVAAKSEQIEAITDAVTSIGFSPEIVDVAPIALTNAVRAAAGMDDCVVILDIGAKTTSLVISEGERMYSRSIPIAGNQLTREISQTLGCTVEEAEQLKQERGYVSLGGVAEDEDEVADRISKICRAVMSRLQAEISRSVNFYRSQQGGGVPVKLYLTGGSALLPQIDSFFAEALQVDVECFNMFDFVGIGGKLDAAQVGSDGALMAPTAGLATHLAGSAHFAINLLPPSIVHDRAERARIPVVAAAGVMLVAALALVLASVKNSGEVLKEASEAASGETASLRKFETRVSAASAKADAAAERSEKFRQLLVAREAAVARINAVRGAISGGIWIEKWEGGKITLRGWKDRVKMLVDAAAAGNGGKRIEASEIIVGKLKGRPEVKPESVKIAEMTEIGKDGQIKQCTVELEFK